MISKVMTAALGALVLGAHQPWQTMRGFIHTQHQPTIARQDCSQSALMV
ncbi:hypothetical protein [Profundibacter sp.]